MKNGLSKKCKFAVDYGLSLDAEQIEAYASFSKLRKINIEGQTIDEIHTVDDAGIGVRVYINKGLGFSYSQNLDETSIKKVVQEAVELARIASPDPYFKTLPSRVRIKKIRGLFDKKLSRMSTNLLAKRVQKFIKSLKKKEGDVILRGMFEIDSGSYAVANSLGVLAEEPYSVIVGWLFVILRDKNNPENTGSAFDWCVSRSWNDFDWDYLGDELLEKACKTLNSKITNTRKTTILLSPKATNELFENIASAVSGTNVLYKRSFLEKFVGKKIAPKFLDVYVDYNTPGGAKTQSFDSEGCPTSKFPLIKNGILKNFLLYSYSALALKKKNNACGMRFNYKSTPYELPGNIKVKPSNIPLKKIISEIKDGIYVNSSPQINPTNGVASSMIDYGIEIKDGKFQNAVKGTMIGFNAIDVLKNIDAVSKETRKIAGYILPYIRIKDVQISGTDKNSNSQNSNSK